MFPQCSHRKTNKRCSISARNIPQIGNRLGKGKKGKVKTNLCLHALKNCTKKGSKQANKRDKKKKAIPHPVSPMTRVTRFSRILSTILARSAKTGSVWRAGKDDRASEDVPCDSGGTDAFPGEDNEEDCGSRVASFVPIDCRSPMGQVGSNDWARELMTDFFLRKKVRRNLMVKT